MQPVYTRYLLTECVSGIYEIRNRVNGKVYVGSANDIGRRWYEHRKCLNRGSHGNAKLLSAWRKYGDENFSFAVLEMVSEKSELIAREQYWMDQTRCFARNVGYNIQPKAASALGVKHTAETKQRARERMLARPESAKAKWRTQFLGRKHTLETKAKMRAAALGRVPSEETRIKLRNRKVSEETRAKMRARVVTPETREKLRRLKTGKKYGPTMRAKVSAAMKRRDPASEETREKLRRAPFHQSPEWRAKISEANKRRDPAIKAKMLAAAQAYWVARKAERENAIAA